MELSQLRSYASVVETQSFSRAAQALGISQPTISAHVNALEKECDSPLIIRTTKQFKVTKRGTRLYIFAKRMLELEQCALADKTTAVRKHLDVCVSSVPLRCIMKKALPAFLKQNPDTTIKVSSMNSGNALNRLEEGTCDIALVGTKVSERLSYLPLMKDELLIVTSNTPKYQALIGKEDAFVELLGMPFIGRNTQSGIAKEAAEILEKNGYAPRALDIVMESDDIDLISESVRDGAGISIMSSLVIDALPNKEDFLTFPVGRERLIRTIYIAYRSGSYQSQLFRDFVKAMQEFSATLPKLN